MATIKPTKKEVVLNLKRNNMKCPKGYTWNPNTLKCVKINTETITNKKSGTSYFASPEGTVYGTGKKSQVAIDTTGYGSGKKEFAIKTNSPKGITTKKISKKEVIPFINNLKKEVKSGQKKKGGTVKTKKK